MYSELVDGKTFLLDIDYGKTENGTNIGIYGNTDSDAQLFKLVDNGDGTYAICTKVTNDGSGIGVTSGSKENGANVIEWECNDSDDQKWILEISIDKLNGKLIKDLAVKDLDNYQNWKIDDSAETGDLVFGDRDVTYLSIPESLIGAEMIQTACDSKNSKEDLAEFTSDKDITVYVAIDTRVESSMGTVPEWLKDWTKTGEQATNSGDVTFDIYEKSYKAGEKVTLGANSTNYNVVNYTVFVKESKTEPVEATTVPTTAQPTVSTTTTTVTTTVTETPVKSNIGDANEDGVINMADTAAIIQYIGNKDTYGLTEQGILNADTNADGQITGVDAFIVQRLLAHEIDKLPYLE